MEFRMRRISILEHVDGSWIETFKVETSTEQHLVRDIASVFLGFGTARERQLEKLLEEKK